MRHYFKLLMLTMALLVWFAASAQVVPVQNPTVSLEKQWDKSLSGSIDASKLASEINLPQEQIKTEETVREQAADNNYLFKQEKNKRLKSQIVPGQAKSLKVVKVTRKRANVPEGYSQITLNVLDTGDAGTGVWGDGTGYQMLLDANHDTYGSTIPETGALTTSGDVPATTYALFEYKIPENADGALSTTNIILSGSASITIPSGTYDWCITNPTPEQRMWIASEQGDVQGRYDDFVFESGFAYTFTISLVGQNDYLEIEITSNYENPTNLEVTELTNHQATITWSPGGNETSWNVGYKKKTDFNWTSGGTVSSANFSIENLDALTAYQVRVQSIYDDGLSGWSLITFKTANNAAEYCGPEDMGEISYSLSDSYGDGWNGAAINIVDSETGGIIESITLESGSSASGTVSICYGRTVDFVWTQGDYPGECSFTITDPNGEVIYSATSGSSIANGNTFVDDFLMRMPDPTTALDFESVDVNTSKSLTAYVYNQNTHNTHATLTTDSPFSVTSSSVTLKPGINNVPVTFTPTDAISYSGTLTIENNGTTITIALKGVGNITGSPEALRDSAFFAGIRYEWTDSENNTHESNLAQTATDPDQIIAMLKKIYMDPTIPGSLKRGFSSTGADEAGNVVNYPGVGTISHSGSSYGSGYSYANTYGWGIDGTLETPVTNHRFYINQDGNYYTVYADYCYMDSMQYKPNNEGLTLIMLETVDDFKYSNVEDAVNALPENATAYKKLRTQIENSVKSARIITEAKRTGEGLERGTLFKIDADKLNKFFLLSKGQVRRIMNSYVVTGNQTSYTSFRANPSYFRIYQSSTLYEGFIDADTGDPFYHMFEQFSPVTVDSEAGQEDVYQSLVKMQSFGVKHDCAGITMMNHHFMMYGEESAAADCADVRDLMFFVPDYRMMNFGTSTYVDDESNRDRGLLLRYLNYHRDHMPTLGLYVIRQNEIQGAQVSGKEMYKLTLNWVTNLDDFLPSDEQEFNLYQVITDDNGVEQYVPVYYMNDQGQYTDKDGNVVTTPVPIVLHFNSNDPKEYTEVYVPMQNASQQVTYAIQGCDTGHFLSLQMSNKRDYIIPGLDNDEMIKLTDATHYSRFNPQSVKNCYSNKILLENNAIGLNNNAIVDGENGTQVLVKRTHGDVIETIATITFNNHASDSRTLTVTMANQSPESEYPKGKNDGENGAGAGYHANKGETSWSQSYNVVTTGDNAGNIILNPALTIFDNFVVDVSNNEHPSNYTYEVETNYPGAVYLVTNNGTDYTNGAVWYAWTWNDANDGMWVKGRTTSQAGKYMFTPMKANVKFVRTNPNASVVPSWDAAWNETGNLLVIGETFTLNGWLTGSWNDNDMHTAHSNDLRIPVYKTNSRTNGHFSKDEVDEDTGHGVVVSDLQFDAKVQYSSKTEILRYDAYRWNEGETRYIIKSVGENDDEEDIAPTGIAGNQDGSYTASMNDVQLEPQYYTTTSVTVAPGEDDKWAEFIDKKASSIAGSYVYAPVVETFTSGNDVTGVTRTDYNTYGGPLQRAASATLQLSLAGAERSGYFWEENGNKYSYYNIKLKVENLTMPDENGTYNVYKVRAWRKVAPSLLNENNPGLTSAEIQSRQARKGDNNGEYLFEELGYEEVSASILQNNYVFGSEVFDSNHSDDLKMTFGAQRVALPDDQDDKSGTITELPIEFVVRVYFTLAENLTPQGSGNGAPRRAQAEPQYYIAEQTFTTSMTGDNVVTAVNGVKANREVKSVTYVNSLGMQSSQPFNGVNVVVTRYTDGTITTTKIVK